jgi:hypothetical protein
VLAQRGGSHLPTRYDATEVWSQSAAHRIVLRFGMLTVRPPGVLGVATGLKVRPGEMALDELRAGSIGCVAASRWKPGLGARCREGDMDGDWP